MCCAVLCLVTQVVPGTVHPHLAHEIDFSQISLKQDGDGQVVNTTCMTDSN